MSGDFEKRRALVHAAAAACMLAALPALPQERVIRITAQKFVFLPREATLKRGEPVVLEFVTKDVAMGFNCPELGVRCDILPGQAARVRLTPDKAGTFKYICDLFCGDGHEAMEGTLKVLA